MSKQSARVAVAMAAAIAAMIMVLCIKWFARRELNPYADSTKDNRQSFGNCQMPFLTTGELNWCRSFPAVITQRRARSG